MNLKVKYIGLSVATLVYFRGDYLVGTFFGLVFAIVAFAVVWLVARTLFPFNKKSIFKALPVLIFVIFLGLVMENPGSINPAFDSFMRNNQIDRNIKHSVSETLKNNKEYGEIGFEYSFSPRRVIFVTINGRIQSQATLNRLREELLTLQAKESTQDYAMEHFALNWKVTIIESSVYVNGPDYKCFESEEDREQRKREAAPDYLEKLGVNITCLYIRERNSVYPHIIKRPGYLTYKLSYRDLITIKFHEESNMDFVAALESLKWSILELNNTGEEIVIRGDLLPEIHTAESDNSDSTPRPFQYFRLQSWGIAVPFKKYDSIQGNESSDEGVKKEVEMWHLVDDDFDSYTGKIDLSSFLIH